MRRSPICRKDWDVEKKIDWWILRSLLELSASGRGWDTKEDLSLTRTVMTFICLVVNEYS